jgi:micrococcal nuclease
MKLLYALMLCSASFAADIPASEAAKHMGETGTVCGKVASARHLDNSLTFLNFEKPYPDTPFTAIIRPENREKFGKPEETYLNRDVCVTGKIEEYNKKPQIVLTEPSQLKAK